MKTEQEIKDFIFWILLEDRALGNEPDESDAEYLFNKWKEEKKEGEKRNE